MRDEQRLAEQLLEVIRQPELRARIGTAARQMVLDRFTIQRQVHDHEALYQELANLKS